MADHDHTDPPSDPALRVKALESLLVEKGIVDPELVGAFADYYEHRVGPRNGARSWRGPGATQPISSASSPTAPRPEPIAVRCTSAST